MTQTFIKTSLEIENLSIEEAAKIVGGSHPSSGTIPSAIPLDTPENKVVIPPVSIPNPGDVIEKLKTQYPEKYKLFDASRKELADLTLVTPKLNTH